MPPKSQRKALGAEDPHWAEGAELGKDGRKLPQRQSVHFGEEAMSAVAVRPSTNDNEAEYISRISAAAYAQLPREQTCRQNTYDRGAEAKVRYPHIACGCQESAGNRGAKYAS